MANDAVEEFEAPIEDADRKHLVELLYVEADQTRDVCVGIFLRGFGWNRMI